MNDNPEMKSSIMETPYAAAALVFGALAFLIVVNRGFRGVSAGGVSIGMK